MEIKVDYADSGVKTLKTLGNIFMFVALCCGAVVICALITVLDLPGIATASIGAIALLFVGVGAICVGLSTIAKTALFKRALLESEKTFVEIKPKRK